MLGQKDFEEAAPRFSVGGALHAVIHHEWLITNGYSMVSMLSDN